MALPMSKGRTSGLAGDNPGAPSARAKQCACQVGSSHPARAGLTGS